MNRKINFILTISLLLILLTGCAPVTAVLPTQTAAVERQTVQYPESGPVIRLS